MFWKQREGGKVWMIHHLYLFACLSLGWRHGDAGKTHPTLQIVRLRPSQMALWVAAAS